MPITVVVTFDLHPELVARIQAVDPAVRVRALGAGTRESFGGRLPYPLELQAHTPRAELEAGLEEAEVLFAPWGGALREVDIATAAPHLRWVQLTHAGAEAVDPALTRQIRFTSVGDIAAHWIAEWVVGAMLLTAKGWPRVWREQQAHAQPRYAPRRVAGSTVGIIGLGAIGTETARLARGLGCRVIATRRSATARTEPGLDGPADLILPPSALPELLATCEYVVLAAPLTPETHHLIDAAALRSMRRDAVLINVGRGALIDEAALADALRAGTIAGAVLDVFEQEPLSATSPLWDIESAMLAPHVAGGSDAYYHRATDVFCANLRAYLDGAPLHHLVDPDRGY